MSNLVFPVLRGLEWDVERGVMFATNIQRSASGREVRIAEQQIPLWKWTMSASILDRSKIQSGQTYDDFARIFGFYMQLLGAYDSFLYEDPTDCQLTDENIGTGDGVTTIFQITRNLGGYKEALYDINGTPVPVVKVNGVVKTVVTDYTINTATGVITFVVAPPNTQAVTVTLKFYFRCRFSDEDMSAGSAGSGALIASNFSNNFWDSKTVSIIQVKP